MPSLQNPIVASYGGGVNSTAMLIGMHERQEQIDLVLFADTGGEKPETYAYVERFDRWLRERSLAGITIVRKVTKRQGKFHGPDEILTLEQHCHDTHTMPSVAYGMKSCSLKFKREPQDEYIWKVWPSGIAAAAEKITVTRLIGFDAGEAYRAQGSNDERVTNRFPLIEWGWDREQCLEHIVAAGLCSPPKSSCFFCPNMTEQEVLTLKDTHPELLERALAIEADAPSRGSIKGLGRDVSWKQIVEYDAAQMTFVSRRAVAPPCECYDGD